MPRIKFGKFEFCDEDCLDAYKTRVSRGQRVETTEQPRVRCKYCREVFEEGERIREVWEGLTPAARGLPPEDLFFGQAEVRFRTRGLRTNDGTEWELYLTMAEQRGFVREFHMRRVGDQIQWGVVVDWDQAKETADFASHMGASDVETRPLRGSAAQARSGS